MIPFRTTAPATTSPIVTMLLIVANIGIFLFFLGLSPRDQQLFIYHYALVPVIYGEPALAVRHGFDPTNFWPLITNTFLHGGWLHLIFNMWTLWLFGPALESRLGILRFLVMYLLAGAAGSVGHLVFNLGSPVPALGASGAIAGVLGGYTLLYPQARVSIVQPILIFPVFFTIPAIVFTVIWFALQFLQGWASLSASPASGGIAWWAHIFGFLAGILLTTWLSPRHVRAGLFGRRRGPWQ